MTDFVSQIKDVSYIGRPRSDTAMFLTCKAARLLPQLEPVSGCLIFAENGLDVPQDLLDLHHFEFSDNPQRAYTDFALTLERRRKERDAARTYRMLANGARLGENVSLGEDVVIEPFALIEHDVILGDRCLIQTGAVIKRAELGADVQIGEYAVIGADGYNLAASETEGEKRLIRIPTLGTVRIERGASVGAHSVIAAGMAGETLIGAYAQLDSFVQVHHDSEIAARTELACGVKTGGFVRIGEGAFVGISASLKNRVTIGDHAVVGMGSVVLRDVPAGVTVYGVPAKTRQEPVNG